MDNKQNTSITTENISRKSRRWLTAASVIVLFTSLTLNFYQYRRLQSKDQEITNLQTDKAVLTEEVNRLQTHLKENQAQLANILNPNTRTIILDGAGVLDASTKVKVYWNEQEQLVTVDASQLPEPPEGKVYQLWRLSSLEPLTPHDAGLLEGFADKDSKFFNSTVSGTTAAFAITLEPAGGSENPTLDQLYVLGTV